MVMLLILMVNIQKYLNLSDDNRLDARYVGTRRANGDNMDSSQYGDRAVSRRTYMGISNG